MKTMWEKIEEMGWQRNNYDYYLIAQNLHRDNTAAQRKCIQQFVGNKISALRNAIFKFEADTRHLNIGSDDGMSDVLHHIVGLGKAEFERCLSNPTLIEQRYNNDYGSENGYKESFSYCFHEPDPLSGTNMVLHISEPFNLFGKVAVQLGNAGCCDVCVMRYGTKEEKAMVTYLQTIWNEALKKL